MDLSKFKASATNDPVTVEGRRRKALPLYFEEGKPITGGELIVGEEYEIDLATGKTRRLFRGEPESET